MKLKQIVSRAIKEDIGRGDITTDTIIPEGSVGNAVIVAKEDGVLAGGEVARQVFKLLDSRIKFTQLIKDGDKFKSGDILFELYGSLSAILKAERTALNFLQHLSGIATLTRSFVEKVEGTGVKILDTRKTTPGLRELEKFAVRCGGGENHRMGLWDMVLIKDNHIKAVGGIGNAISRFKIKDSRLKIEVEVKDLNELDEALKFPIDRVMLDNMSINQMKKAVRKCKMQNAKCKIEASGGINLGNVREIAKTGVDYISIGAITHSVPAIDISLKIVKSGKRRGNEDCDWVRP